MYIIGKASEKYKLLQCSTIVQAQAAILTISKLFDLQHIDSNPFCIYTEEEWARLTNRLVEGREE